MSHTALYPGTFSPPTLGHLDLIERAARLFDHLIIGAAAITHKPDPHFSLEERVEMLETITADLPNTRVMTFAGLAVDLAQEAGCTALIRGLRDGDFPMEFQMALSNRQLADIETLFLPTSAHTAHISATLIREIGAAGGNLSPFIPAAILSTVSTQLAK